MYADDTCIYVSFSSTCTDLAVSSLESCLWHLCDWFNCSHLKLNPSKTNILLFNPDKIDSSSVKINILGHNPPVSSTLRYLGVLFDESLNFDKHVIRVCESAFIFLCSLYRIRCLLISLLYVSLGFNKHHPLRSIGFSPAFLYFYL